MVDSWASEQQSFVPGAFPDVSSTGSWEDVGHDTQVVWSTTTQVGGARAGDGENEYLVCRYAPGGNIEGAAPF